jgi:hypothetical protein
MAKCMQCGGSAKMKKMAKGGPINKPMTYAKPQKGGTNLKDNIYGMPQIGQGAMDGKTGQMKKGGAVKKKMATGGTLKPVPAGKVGLAKLPTAVRNKMGYQKKGGTIKK